MYTIQVSACARRGQAGPRSRRGGLGARCRHCERDDRHRPPGRSALGGATTVTGDGSMNTDKFVREVMSATVGSAAPDATIGRLARTLAEHRVGAVPVVDGAGRVIGIVTEADLARGGTASGFATAADVMSVPVFAVRAEDRVDDAQREMRRNGVGHLPVLDGAGRVIGMIRASDLRRTVSPTAIEEAELRRRVIDRVIDAGGEVSALSVEEGVVRLCVHVGDCGEIPLIEQMLRGIPGVGQLELTVGADVDVAHRLSPRTSGRRVRARSRISS
ncbi:CBS domain-containing protein [Actinospica sp. MGRD01-02]|uniref:CBS domain-containing protein n=1 Tax=Actinospica acidithermotolerans TaxID=2828514 RepID=A0A941IG81_9ACTN|nr:CBS domain-containing protein [Actinospica acidithermotolerans]MBR7827145.1 CBS domain-containing protein [Actinospica acidithermotolerans]